MAGWWWAYQGLAQAFSWLFPGLLFPKHGEAEALFTCTWWLWGNPVTATPKQLYFSHVNRFLDCLDYQHTAVSSCKHCGERIEVAPGLWWNIQICFGNRNSRPAKLETLWALGTAPPMCFLWPSWGQNAGGRSAALKTVQECLANAPASRHKRTQNKALLFSTVLLPPAEPAQGHHPRTPQISLPAAVLVALIQLLMTNYGLAKLSQQNLWSMFWRIYRVSSATSSGEGGTVCPEILTWLVRWHMSGIACGKNTSWWACLRLLIGVAMKSPDLATGSLEIKHDLDTPKSFGIAEVKTQVGAQSR